MGPRPAPDNRRVLCPDPVLRDAKNPGGPALPHPGGPALALAADASPPSWRASRQAAISALTDFNSAGGERPALLPDEKPGPHPLGWGETAG
ncbi:hypothetical protein [Streptomyces sp. NPDC057718]|uniref:hypothetical protein n=1 Tax=Streptomyces sp. NPDC057718 TaxID=3346225 RepID=UPI0036A17166